ncbi:MAG: 5-oxoprolinase subunit PxpA [Ostreibacterium sp.]
MLNINCDMGESFGIYNMGDDDRIMPHITHANIACGMHASDPNHMNKTVKLAKKYGVNVGAHFSLPDLQGFGRREMAMSRDELKNTILYQVGALNAFLVSEGMELSHLKPHGALYGMAAKQEEAAMAVIDVAKIYNLPIYGMIGTVQHDMAIKHNVSFVAEFFADLDYASNGQLIISRKHYAVNVIDVRAKVRDAVLHKKVKTVEGDYISTKVETICVHSDTPNALELVTAISEELLNLVNNHE